jgi:hypothetical protein
MEPTASNATNCSAVVSVAAAHRGAVGRTRKRTARPPTVTRTFKALPMMIAILSGLLSGCDEEPDCHSFSCPTQEFGYAVVDALSCDLIQNAQFSLSGSALPTKRGFCTAHSFSCPAALYNCGGTCSPLEADPPPCGSCTLKCPDGSGCSEAPGNYRFSLPFSLSYSYSSAVFDVSVQAPGYEPATTKLTFDPESWCCCCPGLQQSGDTIALYRTGTKPKSGVLPEGQCGAAGCGGLGGCRDLSEYRDAASVASPDLIPFDLVQGAADDARKSPPDDLGGRDAPPGGG